MKRTKNNNNWKEKSSGFPARQRQPWWPTARPRRPDNEVLLHTPAGPGADGRGDLPGPDWPSQTGVKRNDGEALRTVMKAIGLSETQSLEQRDGAEAQRQEAGAQQVAQPRQVGDGEVVWVQAPPPHQADNEVGDVEKDGHLEGEGQLLLKVAKEFLNHTGW